MASGTHAACAVDGILYVVGGDTGTNTQSFVQQNTLFAYDPKTDSWTRKATMPTARRFLAASAVDGIIYVIGGGGMGAPVTGAVEAYDPKTDKWVVKTKMPTPRCYPAACAVDGIIYTIGGAIAPSGSPVYMPTVEAYDPKTDHWTPKADLPTAEAVGAVNAVNGLIYACYGKDTFAYDPKTDSWTTKAPIPDLSLNSYLTASSAVGGMVYLFGGEPADSCTACDLTLAYDPVQDRFSAKRKMPMTCLGAAAATIDGKIYVADGLSADPLCGKAVAYNSLWVFDPQGGVAPQCVTLTAESTNQVRLVWKGEAGRLYGVESTLNIATGPWRRALFSTGTNSIVATNALVEANCEVSPADTNRFFRIIEAN